MLWKAGRGGPHGLIIKIYIEWFGRYGLAAAPGDPEGVATSH